MLHSANVLCFGIALIFYISYAGIILESLSTSSARFKPKDIKKKKKKVEILKVSTRVRKTL